MSLLSKEKIVVVGFGWVGQANALALSQAGYDVFYYDVAKPEFWYAATYGEQYHALMRLDAVLDKDSPSTWYLVCVGDRVLPDGTQDISTIRTALDSLKNAKGGIVLRSTILPDYLSGLDFDYYVPEFLHEKKAVEECIKPHYFIVGKKDNTDRKPPIFFGVWERSASKVFSGTPEEASYLKYLSNIWNALRVAFVNEFGNTIMLPTDREKLSGIEKLINFIFEEKSYLRYGRSYGGHCLPKDTHAFATWYKKQGKSVAIFEGVHQSNLAHCAFEKNNPHLPEWFSEWVRPQISGWVAVAALKTSAIRKIKKLVKKPFITEV